MTPTSETETFVYQAVLSGALEIRADGTVWRITEERGNRWNEKTTLRPIVPRRVDGMVPSGYRLVKVMRNRRQVTTGAHRLVYLHFYGPIPPGLTINHKNGIKHDNRPDNLELATYSEQMTHAYRTGLKHEWGQVNPAAKLTDGQAEAIRVIYASGSKTQAEIAVEFGVRHQQISRIVRGDRRPKQSGPVADYVSRRDHANKTRDEATGQFRSA